MKYTFKPFSLVLLFLMTLHHLAFANNSSTLPEVPWRAIAMMERDHPGGHWEGDITVKLRGNYTTLDSLLLSNSMKLMNEMCETIQLSMDTIDKGNIEIYFTDSINEKVISSVIPIVSREEPFFHYNGMKNDMRLMQVSIMIDATTFEDSTRQNYITNILARCLYSKYLSFDYQYKKGREVIDKPVSIFNSEYWSGDFHYKPDFSAAFSPFDSLLIKTVYAADFKTKLPTAIKEFAPVPRWVKRNAKMVLIVPLVLALCLFAGLIFIFYNKLGKRIYNKLLRFNVTAALVLILLGVFGVLYYRISDYLRNPNISFFQWLDIAAALLITLIVGLIAANLFRLIEIAVNRFVNNKYIRVFILFLSIAFIPSGAITTIVNFNFKKDLNSEGITALVIIFIGFVVIGIVRALVAFFIMKEKEIKVETEVKLANLRELKTKAELNALHSKINPHFLYNALNSIAGLANVDAGKTEHMALSLSKLFRYAINKEQSDWSTIEEEMEMVKIYLDIEKVRFEDRLTFEIDLAEDLKSERIPRFIIQPLVENSIKHAVSKMVGQAKVKIAIHKNEQGLMIEVGDNGPDFPADLETGFGLQSVYDKLEIMYPHRFELHFLNSPHKCVLIKLLSTQQQTAVA